MGSTVVCALVRGNKALVAHLGDSRAYLLRAGRLKQLTRDHTLVEVLLHSGEITLEEAATHPARGRLTRAVGMAGEALPQTRLFELRPGDLVMLSTDGLTGMVNDGQILSILTQPLSLDLRCQRLIDAANAAGREDNITVVLLCLAGGEEKAPQERSPSRITKGFG